MAEGTGRNDHHRPESTEKLQSELLAPRTPSNRYKMLKQHAKPHLPLRFSGLSRTIFLKPNKYMGNGKGAGQNVSCDFGEGKRTIERGLQKRFWRSQKVGFVWSVPISSKENDRPWTNGGENVS